ncbi:uncharacterized protein ASPGLDRAFT_51049 [Aspergillus glaucus CBS 516.65]|uniref:Uncharacterized protein n=1 Tax=Aspergillus glaucus CBS 516.65 TaxID=1160497 RepID=A0A1L9V9K6_ASPGL|nr:hypothetical protein ASPGLDRAFT_51049 [Aspergillus glaucus CBS 516.65]OJJ80636.1 hypothetical protein ASPGLDRAFT_51049 [Aspergillus glaucus CBS 516.65]
MTRCFKPLQHHIHDVYGWSTAVMGCPERETGQSRSNPPFLYFHGNRLRDSLRVRNQFGATIH